MNIYIWILIGLWLLSLSLFLLTYSFKRKVQVNGADIQEDIWERHKRRSREYSVTHKDGTRVVAESKNGDWKEGKVIGEHDWALFTFFFTIKFDDGEIIKQEERKVTKID